MHIEISLKRKYKKLCKIAWVRLITVEINKLFFLNNTSNKIKDNFAECMCSCCVHDVSSVLSN